MPAKLQEYAELSFVIKSAEARKKVLQTEIEAEFGQAESSHKTGAGTFKMVARNSYEYTGDTVELEEDLKIQKQDEVEQGIATLLTTYGLRFNAAR